jgi:hypothetical protein
MYLHTNQSRSYLNHLVFSLSSFVKERKYVREITMLSVCVHGYVYLSFQPTVSASHLQEIVDQPFLYYL